MVTAYVATIANNDYVGTYGDDIGDDAINDTTMMIYGTDGDLDDAGRGEVMNNDDDIGDDGMHGDDIYGDGVLIYMMAIMA